MQPDPTLVQAAVRLLERSAGRRRRCRRCGNLVARNALKRGPAWSVCGPCEEAIAHDARQRTIEPPLIRRCLVCGALLGHRRRDVRTCTDACRNALSRILRRHRPEPAQSSRGKNP